MHELLTLQIGEAANFVSTHFWNVQESYFTYATHEESAVNHDVLFRPGVGADGSETFTPRNLVYDFKSKFGTLRKINELYEDAESDPLANPTAAIRRQPPIPPHPYQEELQEALLEGNEPQRPRSESIRYWSDYNRVFYNPRAIAQVYEDQLSPQQISFNDWHHGAELYSSLSRDRDLLDEDLRPLVEQCDQLQGFQNLTSVDDGWGGFASRYIDDLRDEYGKKCVLLWGLSSRPSTSPLAQRRLAITNQSRSVASMSPQVDLYVPLARGPQKTPDYLDLPNDNLWEISALQCSAIETLTLPTRLRDRALSQHCFLDELTLSMGADERQRIASLDLRLQPYGADSGMMNGTSGKPHAAPAPCVLMPHNGATLPNRLSRAEGSGRLEVLRGSHLDDLLDEDEDQTMSSRRQRFKSDVAFPVLSSFPSLYRTQGSVPQALSISSTLTKPSMISDWINHLNTASRLQFGIDEREAISDELQQIAAAYEVEGYSEDDSDD